ncbi:MAG TPA: hypothetical protein VFJ18_14715, partial [Pararhizobium sp.]|nr:hypothetical protein [Pararhizobium sp.]
MAGSPRLTNRIPALGFTAARHATKDPHDEEGGSLLEPRGPLARNLPAVSAALAPPPQEEVARSISCRLDDLDQFDVEDEITTGERV